MINFKKFIHKIDGVFGIIPEKENEIPSEVMKLVEERESLRKNKKWNEADKIRAQIKDMGYNIEDTVYGPFLTKSYAA